MATSFYEMVTTLKYLGDKWLTEIRLNFVPWLPNFRHAKILSLYLELMYIIQKGDRKKDCTSKNL